MLARYHPMKDHAGFLEAARRVKEARSATRFVLGGTGIDPGNAALMRRVQDAGLADQVYLLGECGHVASVLPALDVYVSSSSTEASPIRSVKP